MRRTDVRWGVRAPSGSLRFVHEREATEALQAVDQYARALASSTGGQLVRQTVVTTESDWLPVD